VMPTTSQPPVGDFVDLYRHLASFDPDILSIHLSSGLSGTFDTARSAAQMVPEANVTHIDTKTLSGGAGWQVTAAARAIKAGWPLDEVIALTERIGDAVESVYTLNELKYLIHGGRISHMKGLIAAVLNIKPIIGVEKVNGTYVQISQARTLRRAIEGLVKDMLKRHEPGSALRVQVLHALNPEDGDTLRNLIDETFDCTWMPFGPMSLVLGAHTGPSMIGVAYGAEQTFPDFA
ncbi:MAG: DegV family protein, partial [Anaerolineae bacterium]|nr:DegV family protein [Anaerolineae bacterium]